MEESMSLTVASFFHYYIFHPIDAPKNERWAALITSIALGIFSAGIIHLICSSLYSRKFAPEGVRHLLDRKTAVVFKRKVNKGKIEVKEEEKPKISKSAKEIEEIFEKGESVDLWRDLIFNNAEKGDKDFQYVLGNWYRKGGYGLEKSDEWGFLWIRQAAKNGHLKAQFELGTMYKFGKGTDKSEKKAAKWHLKAAEGGHPQAQFSIGSMYHYGLGVDLSLEEAFKWYKKSALQGEVRAMNNLGVMYYNGEGVKASYPRAVQWLKKAASMGSKSALKNLEDILQAQIKAGKEVSEV